MVAPIGVRPGGGLNPLPFSAGGGFTGLTGSRFSRYWVLRPEVWPLFAAIGVGATLMTIGLAREFSTNPRYTINKARRANPEVTFTEADVEKFQSTPLIPHPKGAFTFFNMGFRPMSELRADARAKQ